MEFVVSVDSSDESQAAVHEAASLAETVGASLTLVHSVQRDIVPGRSESDGLVRESLAEAEDRAWHLLQSLEVEANDYDVPVTKELVYGGTVEAVVEYLEDHGPEAVYIGHRDLPTRQEELEGSFAKRLIGESPVPVTVVRGSEHADALAD